MTTKSSVSEETAFPMSEATGLRFGVNFLKNISAQFLWLCLGHLYTFLLLSSSSECQELSRTWHHRDLFFRLACLLFENLDSDCTTSKSEIKKNLEALGNKDIIHYLY